MFAIRVAAMLALGVLGPCALAQPPAVPAPATAATTSGRAALDIVTSDGVNLRADVAGAGPFCLYLHGGPGNGSESIERLAGPMLEQRLRMVYLDQRGSGRSASAANKQYGIDRVVQDLEEVRERLQLKQWIVMSHSFGGTIAAAYARKHPDRIHALVLVNSILSLPASMESTVAYGYGLLPAAGRPPLDPAAPLPQRFGMVMGLLGQSGKMGSLMYRDEATAPLIQATMKGLKTNSDFASTLYQSGAIAEYAEDFTPSSARLTMPVLVISGDDDQMVGPAHYKSFRFPRQTNAIVRGRHFALVENQAEVASALDSFIATLPTAHAR